MQLTNAGRILQEEGSRIIEQMEDLESRVVKAGIGITGSLTVACVPNYADLFFPVYMNFCASYPDISFNIIHRAISAMPQCVDREVADIGFLPLFPGTELDCGDAGEINMSVIFRDRLCVLVSEQHPLVKKGYVELCDLESGQLLSFHSNVSRFLTECYLRSGAAARISEVSPPDTPEGLMLNVRSANYIALHSEKIARDQQIQSIKDCVRLEIKDADASFDIVAIHRSNNQNPSLSAFLNILGEYFASNPIEKLPG